MNEKETKQRIILNYIKQLKEEGKIKDYGFDTYSYWDCIPYIETEKGLMRIFLAKRYIYYGSACIKTIYDYKDWKKVINTILDNQKILEEQYIYDYDSLLWVIREVVK